MLSLLDVMGRKVMSSRGKRIGRVADVLFAPDRARVVGLVVQRPRLLYLLDRKDRYLALDRCAIGARAIEVAESRGAWDRAAASRLGVSWDETVIWVGMPVRTDSGERLGIVSDGTFDAQTGELAKLGLSGGLTADLAVGVRDVDAASFRGFDGSAIVVDDDAASAEFSGGAAKAAGRGAAVAKKVGQDAAGKVVSAGKTAVAYGASAARVAARSETGRKVTGWLKELKDDVADARRDSDD